VVGVTRFVVAVTFFLMLDPTFLTMDVYFLAAVVSTTKGQARPKKDC
jgi:hypothetical protein